MPTSPTSAGASARRKAQAAAPPPSLADLLADECRDRFRRTGGASAANATTPGAPTRATPEPEPLLSEAVAINADDETSYAVKFLAFVYGVPFRLVAIQQELVDVFDFGGEPSPEFLSRFQHWQEPQREAFRALLVEQQRLQLMQTKFENVERVVGGLALSHADMAAAFASAHEEAIDEWSARFGGAAAAARHGGAGSPARTGIARRSNTASSLPPGVDSFAGIGIQLAMPLPDPGSPESDELPGLEIDDASGLGVAAAARLARTPAASGSFSFRVPGDVRRDAVAGADLLQAVLDATARYEIDLAERRYQARLRWVAALTKQQRAAVVHRYLGNRRRDTAELLGISEQSVKTHLQRADSEWDKYEIDLQKPARVKGSTVRNAGGAAARAVAARDAAQTP